MHARSALETQDTSCERKQQGQRAAGQHAEVVQATHRSAYLRRQDEHTGTHEPPKHDSHCDIRCRSPAAKHGTTANDPGCHADVETDKMDGEADHAGGYAD